MYCIVLDANELEIVQVNGLEPIVQVGRVEVVVWSRWEERRRDVKKIEEEKGRKEIGKEEKERGDKGREERRKWEMRWDLNKLSVMMIMSLSRKEERE